MVASSSPRGFGHDARWRLLHAKTNKSTIFCLCNRTRNEFAHSHRLYNLHMGWLWLLLINFGSILSMWTRFWPHKDHQLWHCYSHTRWFWLICNRIKSQSKDIYLDIIGILRVTPYYCLIKVWFWMFTKCWIIIELNCLNNNRSKSIIWLLLYFDI